MSLFDDLDDNDPIPVTTDDPTAPAVAFVGVPKKEEAGEIDSKNWKSFLGTKDGKIDSTLDNASLILQFSPEFAGSIRWNTYAKTIDISGGFLKKFAKRGGIDSVVVNAQNYLLRRYKISIGYHDLAKRFVDIAKSDPYNPLTDHLDSLAWDGVSRFENIFITYFGAGKIAGDTPTADEQEMLDHLRLIGRCWLLGALERAYRPGCKVDNVVVLEGQQGQKKTSALHALGGDYYCSTQIVVGDKDSKMIASSNWFVDLPDTKFMTRANKGFITTQTDTFRPPFGADVASTPRCCIFIGSINPDGDGYFDDMTGNRRYWPVKCGVIDIVGLMRDRNQIWAEGAACMKASETCEACLASVDTVPNQRPRCSQHRWWLNDAEELVASKIVAERVADIPWKLRIHQWWLQMDPSKRPSQFTTDELATMALGMDEDAISRGGKGLQTLIGMAVSSIPGFTKSRVSIGGTQHWVYKVSPELMKAPQMLKSTRFVNYKSPDAWMPEELSSPKK